MYNFGNPVTPSFVKLAGHRELLQTSPTSFSTELQLSLLTTLIRQLL